MMIKYLDPWACCVEPIFAQHPCDAAHKSEKRGNSANAESGNKCSFGLLLAHALLRPAQPPHVYV